MEEVIEVKRFAWNHQNSGEATTQNLVDPLEEITYTRSPQTLGTKCSSWVCVVLNGYWNSPSPLLRMWLLFQHMVALCTGNLAWYPIRYSLCCCFDLSRTSWSEGLASHKAHTTITFISYLEGAQRTHLHSCLHPCGWYSSSPRWPCSGPPNLLPLHRPVSIYATVLLRLSISEQCGKHQRTEKVIDELCSGYSLIMTKSTYKGETISMAISEFNRTDGVWNLVSKRKCEVVASKLWSEHQATRQWLIQLHANGN